MKKIDFLIVFLVLIISLFLFLSFNNTNNVSNNIQLIINNEQIDSLDINTECEYIINSDNIYIYIYKNNQLIKKINNKYIKNIYNKIIISNNTIVMVASNCKGKDCMNMKINNTTYFPIICTNGVVIKITNKQNSDIMI